MRARRAAALVLLVATVLAGCSKGDDESSTPTTRAEVEGPPQEGGRLRVAVVGAASLDPAQARTVDQLLVADFLFDGLTAHDPETFEPVPAVAESFTAAPDQKQWDFTINAAAKFSNDRAITSTDVKYTLERIARKGSGSPAAELLELINGYRAFAIDGSAPTLAGVQEIAPNVVRIVLDQPLAVLPSVLAAPTFGIVPKEAVEAPTPSFIERPVGSGAFAVTDRDGDKVELGVVSGRDAFVEGIDLMLFDDVDDAYDAFEDGDADFTTIPPDQIDSVSRKYGDAAFTAYLAELFYGFNLRSPKFADVRFREAIVRSIDRESIVDAVYGGTVLALDGPVVEGLDAHQETPCGEKCTHDVDRAKALLKEVFPDGNVPEVNIDFDEDATQEAVAKAIEASLEDAGIPATLRPKQLRQYQDFAISGQQELFRLGWIGAYPSADAFLPPLFLSSSPSNLTGFVQPPVDEQIRAARGEPDGAKRVALFQAAERAVMDQLPIIPIAQFRIHAVTSGRVQDLDPNLTGTFDATKVWLAQADDED
jgi:ABC-type oligopeptide transport system substrate-binding subunit